MKKLCLIIIICTLLFSLPVYGSTGETGYNFLKISTGNRAVAMGGAYAGVQGDIISIYYNPSGLVRLEGKEIYFMYRSWYFQTDYGSFSYAQNLKDIGSFGLSLIYYMLPDVKEVDTDGFETGDILSGNNYAFILTYARDIFYDIQAGLNIKYLNERIADSENKSIALDLGIQKEVYSTPSDSINLGLVLQNWGFKFDIDPDDPVPINIKTGIEYTAYKKFRLNFDINRPVDSTLVYNIGAEYKIFNMILLRGGYKIGYDLESFSLGLGFDSGFFYSKVILLVDYSLTSLGLLTDSQNFSLKIRF
ncbi:MAG: PorV/PorQ family protein [Spirochaetes bacterium]|nr:PorV/PorQ family protein [Spirochaetota bacterium]